MWVCGNKITVAEKTKILVIFLWLLNWAQPCGVARVNIIHFNVLLSYNNTYGQNTQFNKEKENQNPKSSKTNME
jgi:hypothetical protein